MIWREWCESEYCNGAFETKPYPDGDYIASRLSGTQGYAVSATNGPYFGLADEKIIANSVWYLVD